MREIKFRAWDKRNNILYKKIWNLQWCFGGIRFAWDDYENLDGETMITDLVDGDYELMQYTGLKDKNGKEIYESDIVKVKWNDILNQKWTIEKCPDISPNFHWYSELESMEVEIIGNIYENPELIK